ncbi:MAG: hypothetical protein P4L51_06330, partial [Puia sp.]|nr:hypothetical protein [Puia sp.]
MLLIQFHRPSDWRRCLLPCCRPELPDDLEGRDAGFQAGFFKRPLSATAVHLDEVIAGLGYQALRTPPSHNGRGPSYQTNRVKGPCPLWVQGEALAGCGAAPRARRSLASRSVPGGGMGEVGGGEAGGFELGAQRGLEAVQAGGGGGFGAGDQDGLGVGGAQEPPAVG